MSGRLIVDSFIVYNVLGSKFLCRLRRNAGRFLPSFIYFLQLKAKQERPDNPRTNHRK